MSDTVLWGVAAGVLLCWAVGAYNRLVRARSQVLQAFGALALQLRRFVGLAQGCVAQAQLEQAALASEELAGARAGLEAAAVQFSASLAIAKAKPFDAEAVAALGAARGVLLMAWQRVSEAALAHEPPVPLPEVQLEWTQLLLQVQPVQEELRQAVQHYNHAVSQFPAQLLAWLFGFRAARPL